MEDLDFESIKILRLLPDDILVYRSKYNLSSAAADRILKELKKTLPERTRIMVIDDSATLAVIKPDSGIREVTDAISS